MALDLGLEKSKILYDAAFPERKIWWKCIANRQPIAAADMDGQPFYEQNLTGALGLVIGSEGFGISRLVKQNCDFTVKMPMIGNVTSLNASVAGGILLYEIFKQRTVKK